jgi:hypothetical protein
VSRRKDRRCADCGDLITARGGRAVRCVPCQAAVDRDRDADRHAANRERLSTLRRLRRLGTPAVEPPEVLETVDYSQGGEQAPRLYPKFPNHQNPRHDAVLRARMQQQESAGDEMLS